MFPWWSVCCALLCIAVAVMAFLNTFPEYATLVFDDHLALEGNDDTYCDRSSLWNLLRNDFWGKAVSDRASNKSYRPLTVLSFRLQHCLFGGFEVLSFRAVNIGLHALNTVLVFALGVGILNVSNTASLAGALIFAVHPVHVEAVTNLVGHAELLSTFIGLTSLLVVEKTLTSGSAHLRRAYAIPMLIVAAALCKETGITLTLPMVLRCGQVYWTKGQAPLAKRNARRCAALVAGTLVSYLVARAMFLQGIDLKNSGLLRQAENPHLFIADPIEKWTFLWFLQCKNIQLLLAPWPLCCEYSYNCLPTITSLQDDRLILMVLVTVAVLGILSYYVKRSVSQRTVVPELWSLLLGIAAYAPVSHLFVTVGTMLAERCLYLPSVGVSLYVALQFNGMWVRHSDLRVFLVSAAVLLVSIGTSLSWTRNEDWMTDAKLFASAVEVCPGSAKHKQQLALVRFNEQRLDEGAALLRQALIADPSHCEAHWHLARYYFNKTKMTKAEEHLRKCVPCPPHATVCFQLYSQLRRQRRPTITQSEELLDTAEILPHPSDLSASAYRQAGLTLLQEKKPCQAYKAFVASAENRRSAGVLLDIAAPSWEDTLCNTMYWIAHSTAECAKIATGTWKQKHLRTAELLEFFAFHTSRCVVPRYFVVLEDSLALVKGSAAEGDSNIGKEVQKDIFARPHALVVSVATFFDYLLNKNTFANQVREFNTSQLETAARLALIPLCEGWRSARELLSDHTVENRAKEIHKNIGTLAALLAEAYFERLAEEQIDEETLELKIEQFLLQAICSENTQLEMRCDASRVLAKASVKPERRLRHREICSHPHHCVKTFRSKECKR